MLVDSFDEAPESSAGKEDSQGNLHSAKNGRFLPKGKSESKESKENNISESFNKTNESEESEDLENFEKLFKLSELKNSKNKNSFNRQKELKLPVSINEISEYGRNDFDISFSELGLDEHEKHLEDTGCKSIEEYNEKAQKLLKSAVGENIYGFKTKSGLIIRYDKKRKLFVKGNFMRGDIITMFRPYWDYKKRKPEPKDPYDYFVQEEADKNND